MHRHRGTVEYELLCRGRALRDLGSSALTWHDAFILLKYAPIGSPFKAEVGEIPEGLSTDSLLLQAQVNLLQNIVYQLNQGKGKKPKPIDITGQDKKKNTTKRSYGEGVSIDEMRKRLGLGKE